MHHTTVHCEYIELIKRRNVSCVGACAFTWGCGGGGDGGGGGGGRWRRVQIRKLEFLLAAAVAQGATDIITCGGIQSNHCRATAVAARTIGMQPHLVLRGAAPGGAIRVCRRRTGCLVAVVLGSGT